MTSRQQHRRREIEAVHGRPDPRTVHNPLSSVNRMDVQLRHNSSNHKRETIAFSKRHQGVADRAAMQLGLAQTPHSPAAILARRRFPSRIELPYPWDEQYRGRIDTPGIANPLRHTLKLAF